MIGLGEILAITSLTIQVVGAVDTVIKLFNRAQNAPDELWRFHRSVSRLHTYGQQLEKQLRISGPMSGRQSDLEDIRETLILCKALFVDYRIDQGSSGVSLRAIWSPYQSARLEDYQKRIDSHYTQIIIPLSIEVMSAQLHASIARLAHGTYQTPPSQQIPQAQEPQQTQVDTNPPTGDFGPGDAAISEEDVRDLERRIAKLRSVRLSHDRALIENIRRGLDQSLLRCWSKMGLPIEETELFTGNPATGRRFSIQPLETAPTTITLEGAPERHRELKLERIQIMARDDKTRILRYYNKDMSIKLTHIIPYGSIPWSLEKDSKDVSFLTPHTITVIDNEVYHIYTLVPNYSFLRTAHCRTFQETFRERDFLGAPHEPIKIKLGKEALARRQVIKFWRKRDGSKEVTMTFLANSTGNHCTHEELILSHYLPKAGFLIPRISRSAESHKVEISPKKGELSTFFKFESVEDAKDFKNHYEEVHPQNAPAPRIGTPEATSTPVSSDVSVSHGTSGPPSVRADSLMAAWEGQFGKESAE